MCYIFIKLRIQIIQFLRNKYFYECVSRFEFSWSFMPIFDFNIVVHSRMFKGYVNGHV